MNILITVASMYTFTIYKVAILNKAKEYQRLGFFNGENDLLRTSESFYYSLNKNTIEYLDSKQNKRAFSITDKFHLNEAARYLVAKFDSAYTGESFEIRDGETNSLNYPVNKSDLQSRKLFSLLYIPKNRKFGYVVFENKSKHGVKLVFEREFNRFLKENYFTDFRLELTPGLNFNFLSNMIEKGVLKKIRLINYQLSHPVQLSLWNQISLSRSGNEEITEWNFSKKTENNSFKQELYSLFFSDLNDDEKIPFRADYESDEISFVINYKNASKTFYVRNKGKMRSNLDVSGRLEFLNEEPTHSSKIKVALELIREIEGYDPLKIDEVA